MPSSSKLLVQPVADPPISPRKRPSRGRAGRAGRKRRKILAPVAPVAPVAVPRTSPPPPPVVVAGRKRRRHRLPPPAPLPLPQQRRLPDARDSFGGIEVTTVLETFRESCSYVDSRYPRCMDMYRRGVVIDWMMEVCDSLSMRDTTFALSVSIFDRYVRVFSEENKVRNSTLQPVAAVAIFIASKHEERIPVRVAKLVDICAGSIKPITIYSIEPAVLNALNWKVFTPLTLNYIDAFFFNHTSQSQLQLQLARFVSKIALLDINLAAVAPALIAAAIVEIVNTVSVDININIHCGSALAEPATRKVARRILKVWNYAVASHDSGNSMFVIRKFPKEAARIFPPTISAAIASTFGDDVAPMCTAKGGKFAAWARRNGASS